MDGGGGPSSFSSSESLLSVFFLLRFVLFFVCRLISSFSASVYVQLLPVNFMCAKKSISFSTEQFSGFVVVVVVVVSKNKNGNQITKSFDYSSRLCESF